MFKKIFVTGGAGFIGSNFIHYMQNKYKNLEILNYDALTYASNLKNLDGLDSSRHSFLKGDIRNQQQLLTAITAFKPDAMVAFAAETHVDNSIKSPSVFLETNILGTENILKAALDQNIKKLIHISTDEVYGSLPHPKEATEEFPFVTNSPYSASKAAGELVCKAYHSTYNLPVTIIRGSNCYGPRQHPEKLIPKSITNLLTGKNIKIYADGKQTREWIFADDFCSGVEIVLLNGLPGEAYNLGGGKDNRVYNIEIAKQLLHLLDKTSDHIEYIVDRPGHDNRYSLNSDSLKSMGWSPKYSLTAGLQATVTWYQENSETWKVLL